jgi:hypothetical protein
MAPSDRHVVRLRPGGCSGIGIDGGDTEESARAGCGTLRGASRMHAAALGCAGARFCVEYAGGEAPERDACSHAATRLGVRWRRGDGEAAAAACGAVLYGEQPAAGLAALTHVATRDQRSYPAHVHVLFVPRRWVLSAWVTLCALYCLLVRRKPLCGRSKRPWAPASDDTAVDRHAQRSHPSAPSAMSSGKGCPWGSCGTASASRALDLSTGTIFTPSTGGGCPSGEKSTAASQLPRARCKLKVGCDIVSTQRDVPGRDGVRCSAARVGAAQARRRCSSSYTKSMHHKETSGSSYCCCSCAGPDRPEIVLRGYELRLQDHR